MYPVHEGKNIWKRGHALNTVALLTNMLSVSFSGGANICAETIGGADTTSTK